MAATWVSVDVNWPTFTEGQPVDEQLRALHNYMWTLTEQLKYTLENLDTTNWNATSLSDYGEETTADIRKSIALLTDALTKADGKIVEISGKLQEEGETLEQISGQLEGIQTALDALTGMIAADEASVTIGGTGKAVNLNGTVKINGKEM